MQAEKTEKPEREKTCAERIDKQYESAMRDVREALKNGWDEAPEGEDNRESYDNNILSIMTRVEVEIQLSWGGPSDGIILTVDKDDGAIIGAEYYFKDWFDGAKKEILGEDLDQIKEMFASHVETELIRVCYAN